MHEINVGSRNEISSERLRNPKDLATEFEEKNFFINLFVKSFRSEGGVSLAACYPTIMP